MWARGLCYAKSPEEVQNKKTAVTEQEKKATGKQTEKKEKEKAGKHKPVPFYPQRTQQATGGHRVGWASHILLDRAVHHTNENFGNLKKKHVRTPNLFFFESSRGGRETTTKKHKHVRRVPCCCCPLAAKPLLQMLLLLLLPRSLLAPGAPLSRSLPRSSLENTRTCPWVVARAGGELQIFGGKARTRAVDTRSSAIPYERGKQRQTRNVNAHKILKKLVRRSLL